MSKLKNWYQYSGPYDKIDAAVSKHFRKKLNNKDFTIICPNCIGGQIYHRFGLRFDSPTINLSINTPDFTNFLRFFEYYLEQDMDETEPRNDGKPRAILKGNGNDIPDLIITFVHYDNFEAGRAKWYERRSRIDRSNMYLIMFDIQDLYETDYDKAGFLTDEQLKVFEEFPCKNRVLFTRNPQCKSKFAYYIKPNYREALPIVYFAKDPFGRRTYEKHFNVAKFLNSNTQA